MSLLDPVQIAALEFSENKTGAAFFLQQGLGKSLLALTEFDRLYHEGKADRMIVIAPNSFKQGWLDEIRKHNFDFDVHLFQSARKAECGAWMRRIREKPSVLVVNYEAIRLPLVLEALTIWASWGRTYLTIDESIQIKGWNASQTRAVHRLAQFSDQTGEPIHVRYVRILTGRPQTQGPHDLWGQLRAIGGVRRTGYYAFKNRYCVMGGWMNKDVIGVKEPEALAALMTPVAFQAKKKDWLPGLPRKDYTIRDYQMAPAQQRLYNQMERQFLVDIGDGKQVSVDVAIAKYAKLAQIQTGFVYDEDRIVHGLVEPGENSRLNLLKSLLDEEDGKACVVYKHRAILPLLMAELDKYGPARIGGGMKPDEIGVQKARFDEDAHCRVILLQCDAAKYGHTLLGGPGEDDRCRTMIFFENSYSADTRDQIEDRIHRRGQTGESVLYIDLSGSELDRRIVAALQKKDRMYKSVFTNLMAAKPAEGRPFLTVVN